MSDGPALGRLVLVRHGESTWNADGRLQGQADPALTAEGRRQAAALAPWVRAWRPAVVVTSDLRRASRRRRPTSCSSRAPPRLAAYNVAPGEPGPALVSSR